MIPARVWVPWVLAFFFGVHAHAITYPPASAFLYGNSGVNQPAQSSFVSGTGLPYRLLKPKNYDPAVKYPVIIFLHGQGERGTNNEAQLASNANGAMALVSTAGPDNQTNYPCFFVAPHAPATGNWTGAEVALRAILDTMEQHYSIDPDRICLTGLSMGALGSWAIVVAMPNTFSCLVPQSGGGNDADIAVMPRLPVWAFHAENDSTVVCNSTDNTVYRYRARGFPVIYTRYTSGNHGIWSTAYAHPQLAAWIAAQRRGEAMQGVPSVTISGATLARSPLQLTGTSTVNGGVTVTRVGWCNSTNGGSTTATDGVTNGTTTFTSAAANFTTEGVAGHRVGIRKTIASTTSNFIYEIASVSNTTTLILDRTSTAQTGRTYNLYKPGGYLLLNPAVGTGSASWDTWAVDVPVSTSASGNIVHVMAEMTSGSASFGGRTSLNQPLTFFYTVPTGDITAPTLAVSSPAAATSGTFFPSVDISGVASDAVGVTSVTWASDRGGSGTASGTTAWVAANVPLLKGMNTITLTAKDAKGNLTSRYIKVVYDTSITALQNWKNIRFGAEATNPAIAGDMMDPDGDGVSNLMEYALGEAAGGSVVSVLPVASLVGGRVRLSFQRLAPTDVTYVVNASTDLATWTPIATFASGGVAWTGSADVSETGSGALRSVVVEDTNALSPGGRRFLRLSISAP